MVHKSIHILALLGMLLVAWSTPAVQGITPPPQPGVDETGPLGDIVLVPPPPEVDKLDLLNRITRSQAEDYAESLLEDAAQPILAELRRLEQAGQIAGYQVEPGASGIAVHLGESGPDVVGRLASLAPVFPETKGITCGQNTREALAEQVYHLSQTRTRQDFQSAAASDPSIEVYLSGEWWMIVGRTTPLIPVTVQVSRAGVPLGTESVTSNPQGYYDVYQAWEGCGSTGILWTPRPGDVVTVSAHGSSVSTTVSRLVAWADPVTNLVAGQTDPNKSLEILLLSPTNTFCQDTEISKTAVASGSGSFQVTFPDFNRWAWVELAVLDANGNRTSTGLEAFYIESDFSGMYLGGSLHPDSPVTATLTRSGTLLDTQKGQTNSAGFFSVQFAQTMQAGDVIQVTDGSHPITYVYASLTAEMNPQANGVSGQVAPASAGLPRTVSARFNRKDSGDFMTTCSAEGRICSGQTTSTGTFAINLDPDSTMDLERGDYAYLNVFDAEGNVQYSDMVSARALVADVSYAALSGVWDTPATLSIVHKDSTDTEKNTYTDIWASGWDRSFNLYLNDTIEVNDTFVVTDGTHTETMVVQGLTARLQNGTAALTGTAPASQPLLVRRFDYDLGQMASTYFCSEHNPTDGSYNVPVGPHITGGDSAYVYTHPRDGHYTMRYAHAFRVQAWIHANNLMGYTVDPYSEFTLSLWKNDTKLDTRPVKSDEGGWFYAWFNTPIEIEMRVVATGLPDNPEIPIPSLTIQTDAIHNRFYGQAPANLPVTAWLETDYACGGLCFDFVQSQTMANASGQYSAAFQPAAFSYNRGTACAPFRVGSPCTYGSLVHTTQDEHLISLDGPYPAAPAADGYEPADDTPSTAPQVATLTSHTFDTQDDVDWVHIPVSPSDVGKTFYIRTLNLGQAADTVLQLYISNQGTYESLLDDDDGGFGYGSYLRFVPTLAGSYYLAVRPHSPGYHAGRCGATYDLFIYQHEVYLPILGR